MDTVADNLRRLREKIAIAAVKAGRNPETIVLVAVSKTMPVQAIEAAIAAGQIDFGENRMQEAKVKIPKINPPAKWHMIGHLQTNKARDAVKVFDLIQSVDTVHLAREIDHRAERVGKVQDVLVQVNTTSEAQKSGCRIEDIDQLVDVIENLPAVNLQGLMTIGPLTDDVPEISSAFGLLKAEFDRLSATDRGRERMRYLSMGMSGDYDIALAEGANMLRIGTAIFGPRS